MATEITATSPMGDRVSHSTPIDANVPTHIANLSAAGYTNISSSTEGNHFGACTEG